MIRLHSEVAAGILTPADADAIEAAVIDHGNGVTELRLADLTADQQKALNRVIEQMECERCNGK